MNYLGHKSMDSVTFGFNTKTYDSLPQELLQWEPGDEVEVVIYRKREIKNVGFFHVTADGKIEVDCLEYLDPPEVSQLLTKYKVSHASEIK